MADMERRRRHDAALGALIDALGAMREWKHSDAMLLALMAVVHLDHLVGDEDVAAKWAAACAHAGRPLHGSRP